MTIWLDVEDFVQYFQCDSRPTGIQRFSFETYRELFLLDAGGGIRFCRRNNTMRNNAMLSFSAIHFPALEAGILAAANAPSQTAAKPRISSGYERFARRLPPRWRLPLGDLWRGWGGLARGLRGLLRASRAQFSQVANKGTQIGGHQFDLPDGGVEFASGDWFVSLGAHWERPYTAEFLNSLKVTHVGFAVLVYDLIPELFPEWTTRETIAMYRQWLRETVPLADRVFAISKATASDLLHCAANFGNTIAAPVILPMGSLPPAIGGRVPAVVQRPYVLLVSTIEIRKNHALMVRLWRRLLENLPPEQVPDLVFAGKIGWLVEDLMKQMANTGWLNGKIKFIRSPAEPELAALYRNCLFTVFPSFYEGWGLPVTESLSFGKTVAASNRASIPQAGGNFCVYFDPDNLSDAYAVIAGLIEHPTRVAALEAHIAQNFQPSSWADVAACVVRSLEPLPVPSQAVEELDFTAPAQSRR